MYLATGEQCDDGDTAAGDGCSATCQFEAAETEPNDAVGQAMALGSLRLVNAAIGPAGEDDWYSITVPQGASIEAATHQGGPDQCPSPIDTLVAVFDSTGTNQIASDDLDGPGLCSLVYRNEVRNLNAGTYTIRVRAFSASATFSYVLSVRVQ
jgi:cysteine-rich repeat protein